MAIAGFFGQNFP